LAQINNDFESGLIEAVRTQFPHALHSGCHFHFTQAVWRKVQELGLSVPYSIPEHAKLAKFIQLCMALPFIPIDEVPNQFNARVTELSSSNVQSLKPFITYFRATWIAGLFPIAMWNQFQHDHQHRTNNHVYSPGIHHLNKYCRANFCSVKNGRFAYCITLYHVSSF
jgi:hypothetical protein